MLTTYDLYTKPGYGIEVGDKVEFTLRKGLELYINEDFKAIILRDSQDSNSRVTLIGRITNYRPQQPGELEIEGEKEDGYTFRLKITQCEALKILEED